MNKLITTALRSQDLKKILKNKILFVTKERELREIGYKGCKSITPKHLEHFRKDNKNEGIVSVLNEMPFDEALSLYESHSE